MIPLSDDNPTFRTPVVTIAILVVLGVVWLAVQGAGLDGQRLAASVCDLGMVPAELTKARPVGFGIPIGEGLACVIDDYAINWLTPLTSMFLHGSWGHLLGNALFFWVFGNNVEDSMGRGRFLAFYLLCGLIAAGAHVAVEPESPVPTVGASGAISGALGAYMIMYPRVRVRMFLPPIFIFHLPAFFVLAYWFLLQFLEGLPQLFDPTPSIAGGTAVWAHVGGFLAGAVLGRVFEDRALVARRRAAVYARLGLVPRGLP